MDKKFLLIKFLAIIIIAIFLIMVFNKIKKPENKIYRVLHVASYNADLIWVKSLERGIKKSFKDNHIQIQYKAFYMSTDQDSTRSEIEKSTSNARKLIVEFKPDIIITSDEDAFIYVALPLANTKYNFVSCGINSKPKIYKLPVKNIAAVFEKAHYIEAVEAFKILVPNAKKIIVLSEKSKTSNEVMKQFQEVIPKLPVKILYIYKTNSFEEWKRIVKNYQNKADAIMVNFYFSLKTTSNKPVSSHEVIKWITENSSIPEFSSVLEFVEDGGLITVAVNGESQGYAAADIAVKILYGEKPSNIKSTDTKDGIISINARRAKSLNLRIPPELLDSSKILW
ncbi:MAG: ABC transporter substrate binding protein [Candidatus Gastranaerophilaceae bacterium]|jgi:ABC-type uncharacterized transport system substrate-binding protein